jgi:hypothetical protein
MKKTVIFAAVTIMMASCSPKPKEQWTQLFNGENLDGWIIKIKGSPVGENYKNTFRVEEGIMKVSYSEYDTFRMEFGHIYYREPLSSYRLRVEYRFSGEQVRGVLPGDTATAASCSIARIRQ